MRDDYADDSEEEKEESDEDEDLPEGWEIVEHDGVWTLYQRVVHKENPKHHVVLSSTDKSPYISVASDGATCSTAKFGYSMIRATHAMEEGAFFFEIRVLLGQPQFHSNVNTTTSIPYWVSKRTAQEKKKENFYDYEPHVRVGWSLEKGDVKAPVGFDKWSYSYRDVKGDVYHNSRGKAYGEPYGPGDVIGCYIYIPNRTASKPPPRQVREDVKESNYTGVIITEVEEEEYAEEAQIRFFKNGVDQGVAFTNLMRGRYYPAVSLYMGANITCNFGPDFQYQPDLANFNQLPPPLPISILDQLESSKPQRRQKTPKKSSDAQASLRAAVQKANTPLKKRDELADSEQIVVQNVEVKQDKVEERVLEPPKKRRKKEEVKREELIPQPQQQSQDVTMTENSKSAAPRPKPHKPKHNIITPSSTPVTENSTAAPPPKKKRKDSMIKKAKKLKVIDDEMHEHMPNPSQIRKEHEEEGQDSESVPVLDKERFNQRPLQSKLYDMQQEKPLEQSPRSVTNTDRHIYQPLGFETGTIQQYRLESVQFEQHRQIQLHAADFPPPHREQRQPPQAVRQQFGSEVSMLDLLHQPRPQTDGSQYSPKEQVTTSSIQQRQQREYALTEAQKRERQQYLLRQQLDMQKQHEIQKREQAMLERHKMQQQQEYHVEQIGVQYNAAALGDLQPPNIGNQQVRQLAPQDIKHQPSLMDISKLEVQATQRQRVSPFEMHDQTMLEAQKYQQQCNQIQYPPYDVQPGFGLPGNFERPILPPLSSLDSVPGQQLVTHRPMETNSLLYAQQQHTTQQGSHPPNAPGSGIMKIKDLLQ